ncbi:HNH endonuclease [Paenibacillus lemnae]|uniref:HNH endonuclease n=1 Tax=Paenibacillus lemnae TaxID=1330551 RepID=A0A848M0Z5_PAELE|nr:HNH endonuclease signature motif containing protein [Paenibacillus lemnae]NMO94435.1 HNH endonuclease [Paenibacillus lemnae]
MNAETSASLPAIKELREDSAQEDVLHQDGGHKKSRSQKRRAARKRAKARAQASKETPLKQAVPAKQPPDAVIRHTILNTDRALNKRPSAPARPPLIPGQPDPYDPSRLKPTRSGMIRMRGRTDRNRRWQQDIDPVLAEILVRESAAVVVNRHTIRRLYTNKGFRRYILERDQYRCFFCGGRGDTIDHLLPRAKGGHTTPMNCVCACMECNQSKADRDLEDFIHASR